MSRYLVTIHSSKDRERAHHILSLAPFGARIEIKAAKRTLPQNDRMWAMLTDVAQQVEWHGQKLRPDDWKDIFTAGLKRELRTVPNIDGDGYVAIGASTSDMSKDEIGNLMDLIEAFGAKHGVVFHDKEDAA